MYLHLGEDTIIPFGEIIGIFDLDTSTVSKHTRKYLKLAQESGRVVNVTQQLPKSFVVCENPQDGYTVYISQISTATLHKRADVMREIRNRADD